MVSSSNHEPHSSFDRLRTSGKGGLAWRRLIDEKGIRAAIHARDGPFGDYSAGRR